ncbi:uncharacterized protein PSFLO_04261 [Pseudozyma flocculosa]|uniref:Uncharacterized protein n=1 Tax=Pseudozyma flocculosa TaxID=84751 RepID=A0A5C3F374_9BASI|nr:uncharacterized protein PSFLO_04261 [Pseudozyma flocculosa]
MRQVQTVVDVIVSLFGSLVGLELLRRILPIFGCGLEVVLGRYPRALLHSSRTRIDAEAVPPRRQAKIRALPRLASDYGRCSESREARIDVLLMSCTEPGSPHREGQNQAKVRASLDTRSSVSPAKNKPCCARARTRAGKRSVPLLLFPRHN